MAAESANKSCSKLFGDAKFPLNVRLTNHLPRNLAFPEVDVFLPPLGGKKEACVKSFAELQRLVASIEQIALLNRHGQAVSLEELVTQQQPVYQGKKAQQQQPVTAEPEPQPQPQPPTAPAAGE